MKHIVCENCGASLDFGEKCDCGSAKAASDMQNASADKPKVVIDGLHIDTVSAVLDKPAPMPAHIVDMINCLRAKA